ncbi:MAG: hypothetical protein ETSY2_44075 [Candidatus Entotheonella gemina]|uniref:Uncharacterized protein n=1 Tax=Candidatus Entotheonella gemina TaxID=1429439 RepID=W4LIA2_9BACT|nr:MAG: hypothetical protein ETSY2_44075 [Candidatus Entotheonella gemina]
MNHILVAMIYCTDTEELFDYTKWRQEIDEGLKMKKLG